jgi:hypothetical protein
MKNNRPSHSILNVIFALGVLFLLFVIGAVFHRVSNQTSEQLQPERETPQRLEVEGDRR